MHPKDHKLCRHQVPIQEYRVVAPCDSQKWCQVFMTSIRCGRRFVNSCRTEGWFIFDLFASLQVNWSFVSSFALMDLWHGSFVEQFETCLESSQMLRVTSVEAWRITIARSPSWDGFLWARNTAIFRSSSRPSCIYTAKGKIRHGAQDFLFFSLSTPAAVLDALFFQGIGWRIKNPHGRNEGHLRKAEACHTVQPDRSSWHFSPVPLLHVERERSRWSSSSRQLWKGTVPKSFSLLNRFMSDSFHFHVTFIWVRQTQHGSKTIQNIFSVKPMPDSWQFHGVFMAVSWNFHWWLNSSSTVVPF